METGVEAFAKGYAAMGAVREDMASQDILKSLYAGQDAAEIAKDPTKAAATLNQASAIAGSRGYASLAHSFQKQAGDLTKNVQEQQINDIKVKQSRLNYADQMLQGLPDNASNEELTNAFAGITDETAQMHIQAIIRNPKLPQEQKKQLLDRMSKTVSQNLAADGLALKAELGEAKLELEQSKLLLRQKNAANKQIKPAREASAGAIKRQSASLKDELGDVLVKDKSGDLVPMTDAQRATVASRIENEGRQRYKNDPGAYANVQEAVDEARDDIIAEDFPETSTKSTFLGIGVPFSGSKERVYKPKGEQKAPAKEAKGKYSAEQESWIARAMKANPDMSRDEIIKEGKRLKKL
jgi:hypothetical protein